MVSSLQVAQLYRKEHRNVIAKIEDLVIPKEFRELNFKLSDHTDPGNNWRYPMRPYL
jgi:phage regulator Rha-like protein